MHTRLKLLTALDGMVDVHQFDVHTFSEEQYGITVEYPHHDIGTQRCTFSLFADEIAMRSIEGLRVRIRSEIPDLPPDRTGQVAWEYAVASIETLDPDIGGAYYYKATYAISPAAVMYARKRIAETGEGTA